MKNKRERWPQLGLRGLDGGHGAGVAAQPVSTVLSSLGRLQHQPSAASWAEVGRKKIHSARMAFPWPAFFTICSDPTGNSKGTFLMRVLGCRHPSMHRGSESSHGLRRKPPGLQTPTDPYNGKIKSLTVRPQLASSLLFISYNATKTMHRFSKMSFLRVYQLMTYYFISKL